MPPKKATKNAEPVSKPRNKLSTEEAPPSRSRSGRKPATPKKQETKVNAKHPKSLTKSNKKQPKSEPKKAKPSKKVEEPVSPKSPIK